MATLRDIIGNVRFRVQCEIGRRTFEPRVIRKSVNGIAFDFLVGDVESSLWEGAAQKRAAGLVEPEPEEDQELAFVVGRMLREGDVVFDCGGHHGKTATVFSKAVGGAGRVVAFEPRPENVALIRKNLELNRCANASVEQNALGDCRATLRLRNRSNGSITWKTSQDGIDVDVITLDDYAAERSLWPTFLKIDVEGFEGRVLRGATQILERAPKLAIEIHTEAVRRYGDSVERVLDLIGIERYRCWVQEEDGEIAEVGAAFPSAGRVHLFAMPR